MLAFVSVLAAEGAESSETINPVVPDELGEIFWGAVAFFALWIAMRYLLLPPLMAAREQRAEKVIADKEAAAAAEANAEQVRRDYEATLADARRQAALVVEEARAAAEERRSEAVRAAESQVALERQEALAELDAQRAAALAQMRDDVASLATSAASKVVQSEIDPALSRGVVDEYVNSAGGDR